MDRKTHVKGGRNEPTRNAARAAEVYESRRSREAAGSQRITRIQDHARAEQGAGAARQDHDRRESFTKVSVRKSLLLKKRRRRFAFSKTAALALTIIAISIAAQALNNQADGTETPDRQPTHSTTTEASEPPSIILTTAKIKKPTLTLTPTQAPEPEPEPEEETPTARIYDIPLTEELQEYTFTICEEYGVDYEMVLALMNRESEYKAGVISKTGDYGIMQINKVNHEWLREKLGITDFLDPEQSILSGVYMLSDLTRKYEDPHRILMAYNMGERGARDYVSRGNTSSSYSRYIIQRRAELLEETDGD